MHHVERQVQESHVPVLIQIETVAKGIFHDSRNPHAHLGPWKHYRYLLLSILMFAVQFFSLHNAYAYFKSLCVYVRVFTTDKWPFSDLF